MAVTVLTGDCRELLGTLAPGSAQTCVTSPPYYGLRDYGVDGQIGLEGTVEGYVAELVAVFREVRRVLADDGTCWVNLGDSYAVAGGRGEQGANGQRQGRTFTAERLAPKGVVDGLKPKDLIGIPWRVAFALQADGWWLRSDLIWHKPNPMPESVTDRPTKAHEYIFLLAKRERYYYDADAIAEPVAESQVGRVRSDAIGGTAWAERNQHSKGGTYTTKQDAVGKRQYVGFNDRYFSQPQAPTRNARTVWTVTTKPFAGAHFATFPPDLIEPCVKAGTSEHGQCAECAAPWRRTTERSVDMQSGSGRSGNAPSGKGAGGTQTKSGDYDIRLGPVVSSRTTGWEPTCKCGAGVVPQTVLDPFGGSGTTGLVADRLGRNATLIELNPEYADMARRRIANDAPLFAEVG